MAEERAKVRVVRCPKCDKLLPELANFTVYRCGGCNATLQGKLRWLGLKFLGWIAVGLR